MAHNHSKTKTIKSVIVTTIAGDTFPLDMQQSNAIGIATLIVAGLESMTANASDLSQCSSMVFKELKVILDTPPRSMATLTQSLSVCTAIPVGVKPPAKIKFKRGVATIPYNLRYTILSTDIEERQVAYQSLLDDVSNVSDLSYEELTEAYIQELRLEPEYTTWFSLYTRSSGDTRGISVVSRGGMLYYEHGGALTIPHPVHGNDIIGIVSDEFKARYPGAVIPGNLKSMDSRRIARIDVVPTAGERFVLEMKPSNVKHHLALAFNMLKSISLNDADFRHLLTTVRGIFTSRISVTDTPNQYTEDDVNPELYYTCVLPRGGDIAWCVENPSQCEVESQERLHGYNLGRYISKVRRRIAMAPEMVADANAQLKSLLEGISGTEPAHAILVDDMYFLGDSRTLIIRNTGAGFQFGDGEPLTLPHPDYGDDILAVVCDKYMRTFY